jgi:hypothetical protein
MVTELVIRGITIREFLLKMLLFGLGPSLTRVSLSVSSSDGLERGVLSSACSGGEELPKFVWGLISEILARFEGLSGPRVKGEGARIPLELKLLM